MDWRDLKRIIVPKDASFVNGKTIGGDQYRGTLLDIIKKGDSDFRLASKNESLVLVGKTLSHELEHAKQFQLLLSCKGGKEKFLSKIKSSNLTEKALKEIYPFVYGYKPTKMLSSECKIFEEIPNGYTAVYGINDILNAFTNYTSKDKTKYYLNLTEISARNAERKYFEKLLNGELKTPEGVSKEFLQQRKDYFSNIVYELFRIKVGE